MRYTPEDHHASVLKSNIVLDSVVRGIEVVGECRELGCDGVDLLDEWCNRVFLA